MACSPLKAVLARCGSASHALVSGVATAAARIMYRRRMRQNWGKASRATTSSPAPNRSSLTLLRASSLNFDIVKILHRYVIREHVAPFLFAGASVTSIMMLRYLGRRFGDLVGKGLD